MHMRCLVAQSCRLFVTSWTVACQDPLSMWILWARILEWIAMPSSRASSQSTDQTQVSHIAGRFFTIWATKEIWGSWRWIHENTKQMSWELHDKPNTGFSGKETQCEQVSKGCLFLCIAWIFKTRMDLFIICILLYIVIINKNIVKSDTEE